MELKKQSGMTIYYQIAETLSEQIKTGVYKTGDFLPTEKQLAAFFGVNFNPIFDRKQRTNIGSTYTGIPIDVLR